MSDTLGRAKETLLLRLRLARACEIRNQTKQRDKLLVLAGINARRLGWNPIAAYCRKKILAGNPGHLLNRYRSFAEAIESEDFASFQKRLEREFSTERVEQLLLQARMPEHPREEMADDFEYAAALLGTTRAKLESVDRDPPAKEQPVHKPRRRQVHWGYVSAICLGLLITVIWLFWWWKAR